MSTLFFLSSSLMRERSYKNAPALLGLLRQFWPDQIIFVTAVTIQLAAIAAYLMGSGKAALRGDRDSLR